MRAELSGSTVYIAAETVYIAAGIKVETGPPVSQIAGVAA